MESITGTLLEMIRDSISHFRIIIILLIATSFAKTMMTFYMNYKMEKLRSKNTFQFVIDGTHRAINLTTSEKIDLNTLETAIKKEEQMLLTSALPEKKDAA